MSADPAGRHVGVGALARAASSSAREADSVETTPLTTGPISFISVHTDATAIAPAPMKRTCVRQM